MKSHKFALMLHWDLISRELTKRDITFSFELNDEYLIQSDQGQWTVDKALTECPRTFLWTV